MAVNVNNMEADRLEGMKKRAKEKGFNFPYLYDATQKIGRDYDAAVTPHVFVLDKDRKIAYIGAVDDNMNVEKVKKHYLREAVDALLAGKTPCRPSLPRSAATSSMNKAEGGGRKGEGEPPGEASRRGSEPPGLSQYRSIDLAIKRASCQDWVVTNPFQQGGYDDFG